MTQLLSGRLYLPSPGVPCLFISEDHVQSIRSEAFASGPGQVCRSCLSVLPPLEHLSIFDQSKASRPQDPDDFEISQWLGILPG